VRRRVRPAVILLVAAATSLLLTACGHGARHAAVAQPLAANAPASTSPTTPTTAVAPTPPAPAQWTLVATTHGAIPSFRFPGGPRSGTVPATWHLALSTLPVIGTRPGWVEVRLAQRPNGSTAWVLASDVTLASTPYRIVIDLATTHLMLYRAGQLIMSMPVGIGTSADPTPVGQYFVAFLAAPPTPGYGAFVIVTSAHSNTITDWESSGDAMIAIHGPLGSDSQIGTTGARVSHGCVRLHESDLLQLRPVPVGSPIDIVAT
jgi:lipoprotein-anchoring transpeptidase ErfK/SrfK